MFRGTLIVLVVAGVLLSLSSTFTCSIALCCDVAALCLFCMLACKVGSKCSLSTMLT